MFNFYVINKIYLYYIMTSTEPTAPAPVTITVAITVPTASALNLYNTITQSLSIKLASGMAIALNFVALASAMANVDPNLSAVYNKLNSLIPSDVDVTTFTQFNNELTSMAVSICNNINSALLAGVIYPADLVMYISDAVNSISPYISAKAQQLQANQTNIKSMIAHFALSLTLVILTVLESNKIIDATAVQSVLSEVNVILDELTITDQLIINTTKLVKLVDSSCCVIA